MSRHARAIIGRRGVLAGAAGLLASPAVVRAQGGNGVALVIGNSKYRWEASLPNVKRDAPDIAKRFQALGLRTELLQDAGQDAMRAAIDKFASASRGADLAAFYFAGHGASWDKDTYLVPEDADLGNSSTVQSLVSVRSISAATKEAQHRLLVFDSCRNNPADGWRQREAVRSSSIAKTELAAATLNGPNTLVMFSTAPGRVAVDGPAGQNSPFAAMFLRQLAGQTVDLPALPAKLRRDLLVATEGQQVLWDQSTYAQPFVLKNGSGRPESDMPGASSQIVELNNAYAFAREKGLLLPAGLIALRPPNGSPNGEKIGSFKTTAKVMATSYTAATSLEPLLVIVLHVSGGTAEIIFSSRDWWSGQLGSDGHFWRYSTATVSGPRLEFIFGRAGESSDAPQTLKWSDANSGNFSGRPNSGAGGGMAGASPFHSVPFTRLD